MDTVKIIVRIKYRLVIEGWRSRVRIILAAHTKANTPSLYFKVFPQPMEEEGERKAGEKIEQKDPFVLLWDQQKTNFSFFQPCKKFLISYYAFKHSRYSSSSSVSYYTKIKVVIYHILLCVPHHERMRDWANSNFYLHEMTEFQNYHVYQDL